MSLNIVNASPNSSVSTLYNTHNSKIIDLILEDLNSNVVTSNNNDLQQIMLKYK